MGGKQRSRNEHRLYVHTSTDHGATDRTDPISAISGLERPNPTYRNYAVIGLRTECPTEQLSEVLYRLGDHEQQCSYFEN